MLSKLWQNFPPNIFESLISIWWEKKLILFFSHNELIGKKSDLSFFFLSVLSSISILKFLIIFQCFLFFHLLSKIGKNSLLNVLFIEWHIMGKVFFIFFDFRNQCYRTIFFQKDNFVLRGHSNNTRHFLAYLRPPPSAPRCDVTF